MARPNDLRGTRPGRKLPALGRPLSDGLHDRSAWTAVSLPHRDEFPGPGIPTDLDRGALMLSFRHLRPHLIKWFALYTGTYKYMVNFLRNINSML